MVFNSLSYDLFVGWRKTRVGPKAKRQGMNYRYPCTHATHMPAACWGCRLGRVRGVTVHAVRQ